MPNEEHVAYQRQIKSICEELGWTALLEACPNPWWWRKRPKIRADVLASKDGRQVAFEVEMRWRWEPRIEKRIALYREIHCRVVYLIKTNSIIGLSDAHGFSDSSDIDRIVRKSLAEQERRPARPTLDHCPYCKSPRP